MPDFMDHKPSYLGAFLRHPVNRVALLSAGVVAIFASIPLGWSGLALVGIVALGSEILAALTVPGLASFKASVDREQQRSARAQRRLELLSEVSNLGDSGALGTYQHMSARVQSLYQSVDDKRTTLTLADVEKLEDMTLDYLGLCAVNLSLRQRKNSGQEELAAKRVASLKAQLQEQALPEDEQRQLRGALAEYTEVLQRARRLAARRTALEATLMALPDKMEEVYQLVATAPYSSDLGSQLEASLSRLRIAEEVASEFDTEPFDLRPPPLRSSQSSQAARPMPQSIKN